LIRNSDGKLRQFYGVGEVADEIRRQQDKTVLVLVPHEYANQLSESPLISAQALDKNSELGIFAVNLKNIDSAAARAR
jgi:hypothetical protein